MDIQKKRKTSELVKIPLLDKALDIINKYEGILPNKLLPVFSNQKINSYLKEITKELEILKKLTFHSARHTFAITVTMFQYIQLISNTAALPFDIWKSSESHTHQRNY